jgi:hypothetical protein
MTGSGVYLVEGDVGSIFQVIAMGPAADLPPVVG